MRRLTLVVTLAVLCLPALADEKPWPQKGDTVYVAAELKSEIAVAGIGGTAHALTPACTGLLVKRIAESSWRVSMPIKGGMDLLLTLDGPWQSRFFRAKEECAGYLKEHGQPDISTGGLRHLLH